MGHTRSCSVVEVPYLVEERWEGDKEFDLLVRKIYIKLFFHTAESVLGAADNNDLTDKDYKITIADEFTNSIAPGFGSSSG